MLNGETRKAPVLPPDASTQTAWEEADHKVSYVARGTPIDNPGPDQHSSLYRPTPTQRKKKKLNNKQKQKKDM
jgi:hypothetical protein